MNMNRVKALCLNRTGREMLAGEFADIMEAERNGTPPPAGFDKTLTYVVNSIRQHDTDGAKLLAGQMDGHTPDEWERLLADTARRTVPEDRPAPKHRPRTMGAIDAGAIYASRNARPGDARTEFVGRGTAALLARVR